MDKSINKSYTAEKRHFPLKKTQISTQDDENKRIQEQST